MEVDKISFYPLLLDVLSDLSEAHFVSFDLELTGVASKQVSSGSGKPSLQERYAEVKEAADRYQIIQIGLTCVEQDLENGKYILKPYNFELSPLIDEKGLDVERIFSVQNGAIEFLLGKGFDMGMPFHCGVPYLSRTECREAREKHARRQDKSSFADIQIKPTETESLAFLERVRSEINGWIEKTSPEAHGYVNIGKARGPQVINDSGEPQEDLSRFEKRLVHQLVRAEYPDLVTISKRGFIQVIRFDKEREDKIAAARKEELEQKIGRQKGFRWVVEALHGGNITNLDLKQCARSATTGEAVYADMDDMKAQFHRAAALLRGNPKMLIGHNCFTDLIYLYRTFIGPLPATVEEFQNKIHKIWPSIVDTKYMSTHNCGDINPVSSLEQIAEQLHEQQTPVLEIDKEHRKYEGTEALHEAGYDSLLTAQIAVRLSSKLQKEGKYVEIDGSANDGLEKNTSIPNGPGANGISNSMHGIKLTETSLDMHTHHVLKGTSPHSSVDGFIPSIEGAKWKRHGDPTLPISTTDDPFEYNPSDLQHRHHNDRGDHTIQDGMPCLNSDFWRVYGNKLRVFGTEEGVCLLDPLDDDDSGATAAADGGVKVDVV